MKTYTTGRTLYGRWTKNTSSANLTHGDELANDEYRRICNLKDWPFLHRLRTANTAASTTFVELPYDMELVESVFVTVSSTRYNPKPAPSREFWDELHYSTVTSDTPEYWFQYNGQLGLWPRPSTASNVISINGKIKVIDLANADLTSQTVSITTATAAVTGSGTSWRRGLVGSWLKVTPNTSSDTTSGDAEWYEISAVGSTTAITLVRTYNGGTVTSGTATIGQAPLLPEAFHDLPWRYAAADYWSKEDDDRYDRFQKRYEADLASLISTWSSANTNMVLDDGSDHELVNPNLTPSL